MAVERTLKIGKQTRGFTIRKADVDAEKRTVALSFSSEEPVERWFGIEILDHSSADSVDLRRLKRGGALLIDHDVRNQVGVIEEVLIDTADRKGRAIVRFGRSAKAEEIFQDVLDGIRTNVSVGYTIDDIVLEKEEKGKLPVYRATRWTPYEISLVSVPADINVGIGRGESEGEREFKITIPETTETSNKEETKMEEKKEVNVEVLRDEARKAELERVREIRAIGKAHKFEDLADIFISEGRGVDEFKTAILNEMRKNLKPVDTTADIGMSRKETKQFSFIRAINAMATNNWKDAEFERECSEAVAKKLNRVPQGIFVPNDVLTRDLTKGTAADGGYTVATELLAASFIELMRNRMMTRRLGATVLSGLVGDIAIPKQTGGATAYWVAESAAPTGSQQAFGQVALTPKTVGAFTDISRKLLLQSSIDVENLVRTDLATVLALAIDLAAINGSGANNQPTGILNASGVNLVAIGANGGAPTYSHIVSMETEVAVDNADVGNLAYLTNAKVRGVLKTTQRFTSTDTPVWTDGQEPGFGMVNGYRAAVSNQVPSNLTKGTGTNLSAILYGNWADLIIGEWGALDILVDPYTGGAAGTVRVRVLQDVDIALRNAESFAVIKDAIA